VQECMIMTAEEQELRSSRGVEESPLSLPPSLLVLSICLLPLLFGFSSWFLKNTDENEMSLTCLNLFKKKNLHKAGKMKDSFSLIFIPIYSRFRSH